VYKEHFHLHSEPFSLTSDPGFLYLSPTHKAAFEALEYGLLNGRGVMTLVGEVGTGKTTLINRLLSEIGPNIATAYVSYTRQGFESLLAATVKELGIEIGGNSTRSIFDALHDHSVAGAGEGRTTALVIDEAQDLDLNTFEELRLLSNIETYARKLLQVILVGQPKLDALLSRPELAPLRERVSVRAVIEPLTKAELRRSVEHRLQRVGGSVDKLFTPGAFRLIMRWSYGIPRRANILCDNALLCAYRRKESRVTAAIAREALRQTMVTPSSMVRLTQSRTARWAAAVAAALALPTVADRTLSMLPARHHPYAPVASFAPRVVASEKPTAPLAEPAREPASAEAPVAHAPAPQPAADPVEPAPEPVAAPPPAPTAPAVASPSSATVARATTTPSDPDAADVVVSPRQLAASDPDGPAIEPLAPAPTIVPGMAEPDGSKATAASKPAPEAKSVPEPKPAPDVLEAALAPRKAGTPEESPAAKRGRRGARPSEPRTLSVMVPAGVTLWSVAREVYGSDFQRVGPSLLAEVRRLNPQLTDLNHLPPGVVIRLPPAPSADKPSEEHRAPQG